MSDLGSIPEGGFRVSHLYDAPREEVFAAWLDADQVARWWAPEGLEVPRESVAVEPRVGGRLELTMVEPGGRSYQMRATFLELVEPQLIAIRTEPKPEDGFPEASITRVSFETEGSGTRMTVTGGPFTDEIRPDVESGWGDMVGKLERLLAG